MTALKSEPGHGSIAISGSISVVRQLLAAGLLDELRLLVHPIAVRNGMRLFDEGEPPDPAQAALVGGLQHRRAGLVYGPADSAGDATYEDVKAYLSQSER